MKVDFFFFQKNSFDRVLNIQISKIFKRVLPCNTLMGCDWGRGLRFTAPPNPQLFLHSTCYAIKSQLYKKILISTTGRVHGMIKTYSQAAEVLLPKFIWQILQG